MNEAYERFQEGQVFLAAGDARAAIEALERARDLEPEKASIRETLARAYFRARRFLEAELEFSQGGRPRSGERLRALRDRPVRDPQRRSRPGPRAPQARHRHAAGLDGLPRRTRARDRVTVVVLDLDGVLWRGDEPIPGSRRRSAGAAGRGRRVAFLTNNSSSRVGDYLAKFARLGIEAEADEVLTSAQAAAALLARLDAHGRVGARLRGCRGGGSARGRRVRGGRRRPRGRGGGRLASGIRLRARSTARRRAVRDGARFVATNTDPTYPGAPHVLPGAGAIVAAVATASGRTPEVAGKPQPACAALVRERLGGDGRDGGGPAVDRRGDGDGARLAVRTGAVGHRRPRPVRAGADAAAGVRGRRSRRAGARPVARESGQGRGSLSDPAGTRSEAPGPAGPVTSPIHPSQGVAPCRSRPTGTSTSTRAPSSWR